MSAVGKRLAPRTGGAAHALPGTDKTGTLTPDKIVLERHTDALGQPSGRADDRHETLLHSPFRLATRKRWKQRSTSARRHCSMR
jgi:hypothetical protein